MSISWARELEWKKFNPGKPPVTKRSAENIISEFKLLAKQGYKEFSIIDDMFIWDRERIMKICRGIAPLKIRYGILARADHIQDEELVKALAKSGCQYVDLGVESFDQKVLDYVKKDLDVKKVYRAVELLNKYRITPKINIMFGTAPIETRESILKTIKQAKDLPVDFCMFSIATPFPGTEFEKLAKEHHWLNKDYDRIYKNLDPAKKALVSYKNLKDKDLEELALKANRDFYIRPKILLKQLRRTSSIKGLKQGAETFMKLVSKRRKD
jgi:anaerobic magnesium-protoporphyrin IX monomethyl ester cyclase